MLKVSPSQLDSYVYYQNSEYATTQDFVEDLCRLKPTRVEAKAGTAFHKMLEIQSLQALNQKTIVVDDYEFEIQFRYRDYVLPKPQVTEFYMVKQFDDVLVTGIVDAIRGNRLQEYKTIYSAKSLEKFMDSWQWRAYLAMDERFACVDYHVFRASLREGLIGSKHYSMYIDDQKSITINRYEHLVDDFREFLHEYTDHLLTLEKQGLIKREIEPKFKWVPGPEYHKRRLQSAMNHAAN